MLMLLGANALSRRQLGEADVAEEPRRAVRPAELQVAFAVFERDVEHVAGVEFLGVLLD